MKKCMRLFAGGWMKPRKHWLKRMHRYLADAVTGDQAYRQQVADERAMRMARKRAARAAAV